REAGTYDVAGRQIFPYQVVNEHLRFQQGRLGQEIVEVVIRVERLIGSGFTDFAKIQPIVEKSIDEVSRPGVIEQAIRLRTKYVLTSDGAARCKPPQFLIWRSVPEKVRKTAGQRVWIERPRLFFEVEKTRRTQYCDVARRHGLGEAGRPAVQPVT